jgi:hypothetical protein
LPVRMHIYLDADIIETAYLNFISC